MGFFDRIANVWKGFLSLWASDLETSNPEAVYEAAIQERIKRHKELKKAVSGIVFLRNKLQTELEAKEKELSQVQIQVPIAVQEGDDDMALLLLQQQETLEARVVELRGELERTADQAEEAKNGLMTFQSEIEKLKREKHEMLAQKANAEARIQIQEQLNGLTVDADVKALDNVREHIDKLRAEADVGAELQGSSLDNKLNKLKEKSADYSAKARLAQLKQQMAAQSEGGGPAAQSTNIKKTI